MMLLDGRSRIALCIGAVSMLCGCPNPNTYTVPRTLDPGRVQVSVAPEVYGATFNGTGGSSLSVVTPVLPTVGVRIGLVDNFELGVRAPNLDSLAVDGKILLLRSTVDIALDPGLQAFFVGSSDGSVGVFYFHLPVLVGLNLSDKLTLVASAGTVYSVATATVNTSDTAEQGGSATGVLARLGLGVDIRVTKRFALHPEVTFMKGFGDTSSLLFVAGLGLNFGAQPNYSDLGGGSPQ